MGIVNGRTTPSMTSVEVIGSSKDLAIAVTLEAQTTLGFAEGVLELWIKEQALLSRHGKSPVSPKRAKI